jgi:hypothetical protein
MWQRLALDCLSRRLYYPLALGVVLGVAACGVRIKDLAPSGLPPMDRGVAVEWAEAFRPAGARRYDLRWTYQTQQGTTRGRAAVRFVPPDSVRFDYRAPFGRSGAAVIVGQEILWSRPEEDVERLIQIAPVFWAAMGIPLAPPLEASVQGRQAGDVRTWRYAGPVDTLTYQGAASLPGSTFRAQMRTGGEIVGTAEVNFADSTPHPAAATMLFPSSASAVFFTIEAIETLSASDSTIWQEP